MIKLLLKIDFFSSPYQFRIGHGTGGRKTCLGGLLSLLVVVIGAIYFLYLYLQWHTNKLPPKLTQQNKAEHFQSQIFYSPIMFTIMSDNETIPGALRDQSYWTYLGTMI